jgi:GMP synthase (glutamine-hydrolysing)
MPVLGICLGAQLMARALGARVYPGIKELGWAPLSLSAAGTRSCLAAIGEKPVLHWHGDTFDLPDGAELLASTPATRHQAFALERHGLALQFHVEASAQGLERWYVGHTMEIGATSGVDVASLRAASARHAPALAEPARAMLRTWLEKI